MKEDGILMELLEEKNEGETKSEMEKKRGKQRAMEKSENSSVKAASGRSYEMEDVSGDSCGPGRDSHRVFPVY